MKLNTRSVEMRNRLELINVAFEKGYVAYLPVVDEGIDLILHRERDEKVIKVQLKGRGTISKKYLERDIWIAFPAGGNWYMAPHDTMVGLAKELGFAMTSNVRKNGGEYSRKDMSKKLEEKMQVHLFP